MGATVPIYEYECEQCGERFEELVAGDELLGPGCPACGAGRGRRLLSQVSPPSRQPRGRGVREGESRRREREAARQQRLADSRAKRSAEKGG
jgi:putative FmdB family regulatory protein